MNSTHLQAPDGWALTTLGEICDIDPDMLSSSTSSDYEFKYIDISSVSPNKISNQLSLERFSTAPSRARKKVRKDDVLMATVRPNLKAFARIQETGELVASTGFAVLRARKGVSHPEFLKQLLFSDSIDLQVESLVAGSNYPAITVGNVQRLKAIVPTYSEQCGIAEVLSALDEQIDATENEKSKLEQVVIAVFDDAFGQAIAENLTCQALKRGRLNPGWIRIPLLAATKAILDFRGRTPLKLGMQWGGGTIQALSANNVEMGRVNFEKETYLGSEMLYKKWMTQGDCSINDILMTLEAPLGNVALVPDDRKYILSQRVILLKPDTEIIDGRYLSLYLRWRWFQQLLSEESTGTTATGIQRKKLEKLPVLVPSHEQCKKTTEFLFNLIDQMSGLEAEVSKLKLLKKSLMHDLLTGKTKVLL